SQKAPQYSQGALVIACLRSFHEWCALSGAKRPGMLMDFGRGIVVTDQNRGLASLDVWAKRVSGSDMPDSDGLSIAKVFQDGKGGEGRKYSARLYSDALTALSEWVRTWNQRNPA